MSLYNNYYGDKLGLSNTKIYYSLHNVWVLLFFFFKINKLKALVIYGEQR